MKQIRALLADRKRAQRGSVLSGVLIMTAMVAIVAGALMTELSTNFIISADLGTKFAYQATMNSSIESSLNTLQATPLNAPCPSLQAVNLNNFWAVPTYVSCWPTVDAHTSPAFIDAITSDEPFAVDGVHSPVSGDYLLGDRHGTVFDFPFGQTTPRWTLAIGSLVTGPPLVMTNPNSGGGYLVAVPVTGSRCFPASSCVSVWWDQGSTQPPVHRCDLPTGSAGTTQPFASPDGGLNGLIYYADGTVIDSNDLSQLGPNCDPEALPSQSGTRSVVAGPIAFCSNSNCQGKTDYVYDVVSDSSGSTLVRYTGGMTLSVTQTLPLPWGSAIGMVASGATLPSTLAITFHGGGIALVSLSSNGGMSLYTSTSLGASITSAPYWCSIAQCGVQLVGVGAQDGGLYLFDPQLNSYASYAGGSSISTTPGADSAGDWYYVAADRSIHELQLQGTQLTQIRAYGGMAAPSTSVQAGGCAAGICVYMAGQNGHLYLVPLDARDAVINACIGTGPGGCSGANPKLTARVEVGGAGNKQLVHIQGWTYYSG